MATQEAKLSEEWIGVPSTTGAGTRASEIYKRAALHFSTKVTQDEQKIDMVQQTASLRDLEQIVKTARKDYESSRYQKSRKWLERLSSRLMYYGSIFDVLAQHHQEYVSLAWGAMKFLLVVVLNHGGIIASIAKGLARIADVLPHIELATTLYQTTRMTAAVEALYVHIIQFLIRAHDWYRESSFRHILHSITRPAELHYQDLLENIEACSRNIERLAIAGSQMELRQMNKILKLMANRVERSESTLIELKNMIINNQSINSSSLVDTNLKVSDLQFSEMIRISAEPSLFDPLESYNQAVIMRNLRQQSRIHISSTFWYSSTLKKFADSPASSLMLVKGTFQERWALRDAAVKVTEELKRKNIPTLWAVGTQGSGLTTSTPKPTDILKSLVAQTLLANDLPQSQKSTALNCTQLRTAATEKHWFDILGAALANICRQTYIIIELENLVSPAAGTLSNAEVIGLFDSLFRELTVRGTKSVVKVLVFTCRPSMSLPQATRNVFSTAIPSKPLPRVRQPVKQRTKQDRSTSYTATLRRAAYQRPCM